MARRKSVCVKWTLVLVSLFLCPLVLSRPQEVSSTVTLKSVPLSDPDRSTDVPLRYKYRAKSNTISFVSPSPVQFTNFMNLGDNINKTLNHANFLVQKTNYKHLNDNQKNNDFNKTRVTNNKLHRMSRLIKTDLENLGSYLLNKNININPKSHFGESNRVANKNLFTEKNKPIIKKVVTKWTDKTQLEDLDFKKESEGSTDDESNDRSKEIDGYSSREDINIDVNELSKDNHPKLTKKVYYKPTQHYPQQFPTYPNNIHAIDTHPYAPTRPNYVFAVPTPTPVISNVGYPPSWPQQSFQVIHPGTTQRPIRVTKPVRDHYNNFNNHHSIVNNYPQQYPVDNFEVSTFQPTSAYTDRIVIRPEEYSASPDDCPTIYLTLNNTFQGQAKEVCPDLNIAVNTNVVNKNVVVESDEESDNSFDDALGIPLMDNSESGEGNNDYDDSTDEEGNSESASIEGTALTNYNVNTQESAEPGGFGSPSSALSTITRPEPTADDDDTFSFSSIIDFFKPALSAFNWLAAINPLSFGIISFILTPLAILFAGVSGLAALFAPLALTYARKAPNNLQIQSPNWAWINENKMWWNLQKENTVITTTRSHDADRISSKLSKSSLKPTLFYKLKEWMKSLTHNLRNRNPKIYANSRKNKRRKRDTWKSTVK